MKKKYREINVDGKQYAWSAKGVVDECEIPCTRVKIWQDKNTTLFDEVLDLQRVTPSTIAEKIKDLNSNKKTFNILLELMEEVEAETEEEACEVFIEKMKGGNIDLHPIAWEV